MGFMNLLLGNTREIDRLNKQRLGDLGTYYNDTRTNYQNARDSGMREMKNDYLGQLFSSDQSAIDQFNAPYIQNFERNTMPMVAERLGAYGGNRSSGFAQGMNDISQAFGQGLTDKRVSMQQGALSSLTADYDNAANRYGQMAMAPLDASQYGGSGLVGAIGEAFGSDTVKKGIGSYVADTIFPGMGSLLSTGGSYIMDMFSRSKASRPGQGQGGGTDNQFSSTTNYKPWNAQNSVGYGNRLSNSQYDSRSTPYA